MKKILLAISVVSLFTGCSMKSLSSKKNDDFVRYDNTNHIVGNKEKAIRTLVYVEKINDTINKKIIFYIDKLPYKKDFDLCNDQKDFKQLKSVITYKNGNSEPIYVNQPIDCKSSITLESERIGSYNLSFLLGFKHYKLKGYDMPLPYQANRRLSNFIIEEQPRLQASSYWYFEQ